MPRLTEPEAELLKSMYLKHHKEIFNVAYHMLLNVEQAEDIVQDTFVKFSKKLNEPELAREPRYWLIRVSINACIDYKRSLKKIIKDMFSDSAAEAYPSFEKQFEINDSVSNILKKLDPRSRAVLIMKYMEDMSYEEISEALDIPVGTLKSITWRAISKIKGTTDLLQAN